VTTQLAIETDALRKRYGDVEALCGVDLAAPQGSVLGMLGPNGAGKTTAVRILTTLLRPDVGTARVAGFDVMREPARCAGGWARRAIAVAFGALAIWRYRRVVSR